MGIVQAVSYREMERETGKKKTKKEIWEDKGNDNSFKVYTDFFWDRMWGI